MQKLQTFWHVFKHSLIPLDYYYHKIRTTKFGFSFKYFVVLVFTLVVLSTTLKTIMFTSSYTREDLSTLITEAEQSYPEDLVITINSLGRLSTNLDKPYILFSPLDSNPMPLVVIDPRADKDKIFEYESRVLLTERKMIVRADSHIYQFNYQLNEPLTINKMDVMNISQNAQVILESYWSFIISVVLTAIIIAPPLIIVANVVTLAIASIVVFIIMKLLVKRKKYSLAKIYQISFHTVTGPLLIQCFMFIFALQAAIPYWYMLLVYLFLAGGVYEAYFDKKK